ncbi:MAG: Crp/Fnr family transcriptional regulator [Lachnospiraceae bacterium]
MDDYSRPGWSFSGHSDSPVRRILFLPRGIRRLEKLGECKTFEKNTILVRQQEKPAYCYVVKKGMVAAIEFTPDGEEIVYHVNEANSVILEEDVLFGWASQVEFKVVRKSELVCITRASLMNAVMSEPEIAMDIIQSLSTKFIAAMDQIRNMTYRSSEWRICDLLLIYADFYGVEYDGKILIQEKISQQIMSNLLGINRITTVRGIKNLKNMGLIEQINGLYCIRDVERLRRHQRQLS